MESGGGDVRKSANTPKPFPSQLMLFPSIRSVRERAEDSLRRLSMPVRDFPISKFTSATDDELHRLRIAAKKMRYTMELYDRFWPAGLGATIIRARAVQDAGGKYHDWSVLCDRLAGEISTCSGTLPHESVTQLLACADEQKKKLRRQILLALKGLQQALSPPSEEKKVLRPPGMIAARGRNGRGYGPGVHRRLAGSRA
jgi:hypothetical protein